MFPPERLCLQPERKGEISAPPAPAGQVNYTVRCGRSCRAMTSMPMSLALP